MPVASTLHRTLLVALAALALAAPAALARPVDLRSEAPTSSLSGTGGTVFEHTFDPYPEPSGTYQSPVATTAPAGPADGIAWLPFVLALSGALIVGVGAGSGLHLAVTRRRHATGLAS